MSPANVDAAFHPSRRHKITFESLAEIIQGFSVHLWHTQRWENVVTQRQMACTKAKWPFANSTQKSRAWKTWRSSSPTPFQAAGPRIIPGWLEWGPISTTAVWKRDSRGLHHCSRTRVPNLWATAGGQEATACYRDRLASGQKRDAALQGAKMDDAPRGMETGHRRTTGCKTWPLPHCGGAKMGRHRTARHKKAVGVTLGQLPGDREF